LFTTLSFFYLKKPAINRSSDFIIIIFSHNFISCQNIISLIIFVFTNKNVQLQAIISGCSAGGLTSLLHCDRFRALLPGGAKVKCISDAGYFINV
jgi:hypothetical protein